MSRKNRRQQKNALSTEHLQRLIAVEVERRMAQTPPLALPSASGAGQPRPVNQDALMMQMQAQQAPAKTGTPMFAPGAPLQPSQGLVNPLGPRQYQFPVGYNISARPRNTEATGFDALRNLSMLYDGAQLCEQVWLENVSRLKLEIKLDPDFAAATGDTEEKHIDDIKRYKDFFGYPDPGNGYDLKSWMRMGTRETLQIDALSIYVRPTRGGGVYSLEIVDGTTIKPLIDPRGRRPLPPYPAYQQFLYGVPAGLYTSEQMIYFRETVRAESVYGLSRNERIILRINQALRKENKDLSRFTDGNMPPGILEPPDDGSQWTPEMLLAYQEMWDALLAGNDQARSRIKVVQPGSKITLLQDADIFVDFDRFLLNVCASCYGMTMADLGFTESVNKSSGETQENVFYRRSVKPLMDRFAELFTFILRHYFHENRFVVGWSGFEEAEDFNTLTASYVSLVNAGIVSPTTAARQLKQPWHGPEIPNYIVTKDGIVFLEDAVDAKMRKAANDAKLAGFALAANPAQQSPPGASKGSEKQRPDDDTPPKSGAKPGQATNQSDAQRIVRAADNHYTGVMAAFMLSPDVAARLALPGGEAAQDLHVTLCYLGDSSEIAVDREHLSSTLTSFARGAQSLSGTTGGIGRFITPDDDVNPVISLVNVPGLQDLRRRLADVLSMAGYPVHNDFDYMPHITLAYIDANAPMPVDEVPVLPLIFDTLCLAIGDERSYFPLGQRDERSENPDFFALAAESGGHHRKHNSR